MNRNDKIKLLNGIASGLISADSLKPKPFLLCLDYGDRIVYKLNGNLIEKEEWLRRGGNKPQHMTIKIRYDSPKLSAPFYKKEAG